MDCSTVKDLALLAGINTRTISKPVVEAKREKKKMCLDEKLWEKCQELIETFSVKKVGGEEPRRERTKMKYKTPPR